MHKPNSQDKNRANAAPRRGWTLAIALALLVIAGVGGILAGNWWSGRRTNSDKLEQIDEYLGLAERTGLTGDLSLAVNPVTLAADPGQTAKVELTLTNRTARPMLLSGWLTPIPEIFRNNQFPLKVVVTRAGHGVVFRGNGVLLPPHKEKDFFVLGPGRSRLLPIDLTRATGGRWDMSAPGRYRVEIWYETYLTGRYIGVKAWTGMTNHVVVQVDVRSG